MAHADSEERSRDVLIRALLSALADPALPLAGVRACAQALSMTLTARSLSREELTAGGRDLVRQATRQSHTARHPIARKTLAILLENPRWLGEDDLAREVAASRSHFARTIHRHTGFDYRTLRRLIVMQDYSVIEQEAKPGPDPRAVLPKRRGPGLQ